MHEITIRVGKREEQAVLEAVQLRASLANPGERELLLANPHVIELPLSQLDAGQVFVAEHDGRILGFAAVLVRSDGDTELDGLFVEPELWRSGVGRALVQSCVAYARAHGAHALRVIGGAHALGLYAKLGFVVVGETPTPLGPIALLMTLKL